MILGHVYLTEVAHGTSLLVGSPHSLLLLQHELPLFLQSLDSLTFFLLLQTLLDRLFDPLSHNTFFFPAIFSLRGNIIFIIELGT